VARARLGWQPTTQLEEGLGKTVDYFARRLADLEKAA
jgi:nucleoside-diphosphate-sugar epimerase